MHLKIHWASLKLEGNLCLLSNLQLQQGFTETRHEATYIFLKLSHATTLSIWIKEIQAKKEE